MACGYRNRDDLKLKQSAFREREQRTIALLVSTVTEHVVQRTSTDKLRLKPYVSNTVTTVFRFARSYSHDSSSKIRVFRHPKMCLV